MINWTKVLANAGATFFTVMTSITLVGGGQLNPEVSITAALFAAFLQSGLAFFKELSEESKIKSNGKLNKIIHTENIEKLLHNVNVF